MPQAGTFTDTLGVYGDLVSEFDHGGGGGSGATLYPVFDAQAATEALLDEGEDVLQRFAYQAFGNPARGDVGPDWSTFTVDEWSTLSVEGWSQMAVSPASPLNFGGKANYYADVETQLYLLGSGSYGGGRYYDPELGRFLSRDPIGFAAGDTLLYRYVGNNPVNALDPSPLQCRPLQLGGAGWAPGRGGRWGSAALTPCVHGVGGNQGGEDDDAGDDEVDERVGDEARDTEVHGDCDRPPEQAGAAVHIRHLPHGDAQRDKDHQSDHGNSP